MVQGWVGAKSAVQEPARSQAGGQSSDYVDELPRAARTGDNHCWYGRSRLGPPTSCLLRRRFCWLLRCPSLPALSCCACCARGTSLHCPLHLCIKVGSCRRLPGLPLASQASHWARQAQIRQHRFSRLVSRPRRRRRPLVSHLLPLLPRSSCLAGCSRSTAAAGPCHGRGAGQGRWRSSRAGAPERLTLWASGGKGGAALGRCLTHVLGAAQQGGSG